MQVFWVENYERKDSEKLIKILKLVFKYKSIQCGQFHEKSFSEPALNCGHIFGTK